MNRRKGAPPNVGENSDVALRLGKALAQIQGPAIAIVNVVESGQLRLPFGHFGIYVIGGGSNGAKLEEGIWLEQESATESCDVVLAGLETLDFLESIKSRLQVKCHQLRIVARAS